MNGMSDVIRAAHFRDPVFKGCFTLFVSEFADVLAYLHERDCQLKDEAPKAAKTILLVKDGADEVVIWFPRTWTPYTANGMALLAHEALHAAHFALKERGVEDSTILDEVGNYYVEWLVREICNRLSPAAPSGGEWA
jgi:hypothetical protein